MSKQDETGGVTDTLNEAYEKVSDKVVTAYTAARERASDAAHTTANGIDANPLVALLGGLAIGAIAGALVPRSDRERDLLAPVGGRIADAARAAFEAARNAGTDALAEAGISEDNLRTQSARLFEELTKALGQAASAAANAARGAAAKSS